MKCPNCKIEATRVWGGKKPGWQCSECAGYRKPAIKLDGILTRNSQRLRIQRKKYAKDFIQPDKYNKNSRKLEINPDFIKHYPHQAKNYFKPEQLKKEGYLKLAEQIKNETSTQQRQKATSQKI